MKKRKESLLPVVRNKAPRMERNAQRKKLRYTFALLINILLLSLLLIGCDKHPQKEILIGAAASLEPALEELKSLYNDHNPEITIRFNFASSGTLEQQIREGAPIDVFISAAEKQMDSLEADDLIRKDTREDLLENELALIVPKGSNLGIKSFEDIGKALIIAIGNPESVPVGQYTQELFESLDMWDEVKGKASFGKDVSEVLAWVSAGNADAGVVYTTDAALREEVEVVAIASKESHSRICYPAAVVKESKQEEAAKDFIIYLGTEEAKEIFVKYGFQIID